jgi:hypothetical protein
VDGSWKVPVGLGPERKSTSADEMIVEHPRRLARRRRTLERRVADADHGAATGEVGKQLTQARGAGWRVELGGVGEPRGGVHVVVGTERDHEDVGLVYPASV